MADDPRPRVLGLLAGRHGRVPHQRRHRRLGRALPHRHRRRLGFERTGGLELLVETARLWMSLGHHDLQGRWHVDGVTGPDEYSAIADDNVFTNLMAARNLRSRGRRLATRHPDLGPRARRRRSRRRPPGATPPRTSTSRTTRSSACTRSRRATPGTRCGTSRRTRTRYPLLLSRAVLRPLPQAGREAGRPGPRDALVRRPVQRRGQGAQRRLLRAADGAGLVAVGMHPGGAWRPRSATSSWRTTTPTRPR